MDHYPDIPIASLLDLNKMIAAPQCSKLVKAFLYSFETTGSAEIGVPLGVFGILVLS